MNELNKASLGGSAGGYSSGGHGGYHHGMQHGGGHHSGSSDYDNYMHDPDDFYDGNDVWSNDRYYQKHYKVSLLLTSIVVATRRL